MDHFQTMPGLASRLKDHGLDGKTFATLERMCEQVAADVRNQDLSPEALVASMASSPGLGLALKSACIHVEAESAAATAQVAIPPSETNPVLEPRPAQRADILVPQPRGAHPAH